MQRYLIALLFLLVVFCQPTWAQKDFSLSLSPSNQTVNAGRQTTFTVTSQAINGFKKPISLNVMTSPTTPDVTTSISNATISPGGTATITVSTNALANTQNVAIIVVGTGKNKTRSVSGNLTVNAPQFALSVSPSNATILQGDPATFIVSTQGDPDFARPVSLTVVTTPNIPAQLSKSTLSAPSDSTTLQFQSASVPVGNYTALITATAGQTQRTATVSLSVMPRPGGGTPMAKVEVVPGSVILRANTQSKLLVSGLVRNNGNADAVFVRITLSVFTTGNNTPVETDSTFINGFSGITSTGVFTQTTLPQNRTASFKNLFDLPFLSDTQRVDVKIDFMTDTITPPKANLVVDKLTRTLNNLGGSDFSITVRNTGTVAARAPQVVIESLNRVDQCFDVTFAGSGNLSDILPAGQIRIFTVTNNETQFDLTRVNTQHAIWVDGTTATTLTESTDGLSDLQLQHKLYEIGEMQRLAHLFMLKLANE